MAIFQGSYFPKLQYLDLRSNQVDMEGFLWFMKNTSLTHLRLSGNPIELLKATCELEKIEARNTTLRSLELVSKRYSSKEEEEYLHRWLRSYFVSLTDVTL